jgi:hypothetical protein
MASCQMVCLFECEDISQELSGTKDCTKQLRPSPAMILDRRSSDETSHNGLQNASESISYLPGVHCQSANKGRMVNLHRPHPNSCLLSCLICCQKISTTTAPPIMILELVDYCPFSTYIYAANMTNHIGASGHRKCEAGKLRQGGPISTSPQ